MAFVFDIATLTALLFGLLAGLAVVKSKGETRYKLGLGLYFLAIGLAEGLGFFLSFFGFSTAPDTSATGLGAVVILSAFGLLGSTAVGLVAARLGGGL